MTRFLAILLIATLLFGGNTKVAFAQTTATTEKYPEVFCPRCPYRDLPITTMRWNKYGSDRHFLSDYQAVFDLIFDIPARDVWIGYENGGFDIPTDTIPMYYLSFEVKTNILDWPLIYDGQLYDRLVLDNDRIQIWYLYSPSTREGYVFPFISMTPTATPQGEYLGAHLWGSYAVPWNRVMDLNTELIEME